MATITRRVKNPDPVPPPPPIKPLPPKPTKPAPVAPEPDPANEPTATTPAGTVKTRMPWGSITLDWSAITRYDDIVHREADPVGWPIERVRGHIVIESQGDPKAVQRNASNGWSYGLMQVVPYGVGWAGWNALVKQKAGLPRNASREQVVETLFDPAINIAVGVAILESLYQQYGTLDRASSAFFLGNPDWQGADTVNGNTGVAYQRAITGLITEQRGIQPAPVVTDLLGSVMGGKPYTIFQEFGVSSGNGLYGYGVGHGLNGSQHTGIDFGGTFGDPLYTPIDGIVVCAGTGVGTGAHGSSCAAFNDYMGHKTGRVEVMTHDGTKSLIFGHSSDAYVRVGQSVKAGDRVASIGGMNGWHCHLEARTWSGGDYMIRDPRSVFAGGVTPTQYAERVPIVQPDEEPPYWVVRVTADELPVLQRGDKDAPEVAEPLKKGETFFASYKLPGTDGSGYWVSTRLGRVPVKGTEEVEVVVA